ncbi:MAG: glucosyltransferase domain-containing protein [Lachnospiraceae bacterium]|nr:glucosyltransferase domain-containing protein [Lachnospiraceae bacterium]
MKAVTGMENMVNKCFCFWKKNLKELLYALIFGILAHFVMLADYLFNHDAISMFYSDLSWTLAQGKWFAGTISTIKGALPIHYVTGILGLVFLAMTSILIVNIFEIEKAMDKYVIITLFMIYPSVAICLIYNALDYFAITAFMSVLAAFIAKKYTKVSWVIAVVVLTLSIGTYQGYISFAAAFFVVICIHKMISTDNKIVDVIKEGLYYISILAVSAILYYLILKVDIGIKGIELGSYKGADNMTQILNPIVLMNAIIVAFKLVAGYLWSDNLGTQSIQFIVIYRFFVLVFVFTIIKKIITLIKKREYMRMILLIILSFVIFPISVNLSGVLSNNVSFYYVTVYPLVLLFIETYLLASRDSEKVIGVIIKDMTTLAMFCLIFNMFILDNTQYEKSRYSAMQISAKSTELCTTIHNVKGVTNDTPVVFVGKAPFSFLKSTGVGITYEEEHIRGIGSPSELIYSDEILESYLCNVLSYDLNIVHYDIFEDKFTKQIDLMNIYPSEGSVKLIDGNLFIKLSSDY